MKFYHGTTEKAWQEIQNEGVLWGKRPHNPSSSYRFTYLAPEIGTCHAINSEVILEIQYEPVGVDGRGIDNYGFDPPDKIQWCWQFSVFKPIDLSKIRRLSQEEIDELMESHKNPTQERFQLRR